MKKRKTKFASRLLDFFVICLCLFVCYYSVSLFLNEYFYNTIRSDKEEVATIEYKYKDAQRKFNDRVVWERIQQNSIIYNEDTIRVASGSLATIDILETQNTKLNLYENTMIQIISKDNGQICISMQNGNVDVSTGELDTQIELKLLDKSIVKLKPSSHVETTNQDGKVNLVVYEGSADIETESGEQILISKNQNVVIDENSKINVLPVTVTSIPKMLNVFSIDQSNSEVKYEFFVQDKFIDENVIVQTSSSSDFSKDIQNFESEKSKPVTVKLKNNKTYWRVFPKSFIKNSIITAQNYSTGIINLIQIPQIKLISPVSSKLSSTELKTNVCFKWQGNEYASHYKIEVSDNKEFINPIISEISYTETVNLSIDQGSYYWRVIPFYSVHNMGYIETKDYSSFAVIQKESVLTPILTYPINGIVIDCQKQDTVLPFVWKSDIKDSVYKVLVSKNKDFSSSEFELETTENKVVQKINLDLMKDGTYYWKVINTKTNDSKMLESEPSSFQIKKKEVLQTRLVYPPENYSVESKRSYKILFMWVLADEYASLENVTSVFQLSDTQDFNNIITEVSTTKNELSDLKIEQGDYYWRVGIKPKNYSSPVEFSKARKIKLCASLPSPEFVYPKNNSNIILSDSKNIDFSFTQVLEASYYKVQIVNSENNNVIFEQIIENDKKDVIDFTFVLPQTEKISSKESTYICNLKAFSDTTSFSEARESEINSISFNIKLKEKKKTIQNTKSKQVKKTTQEEKVKNEKPILDLENKRDKEIITKLETPVLISPVKDFIIDTEYLKNNRKIVFEWEQVLNANEYSFELYLKTSEGILKKVYTKEKLYAQTIVISDLSILDVGEFEWHVTAYNRLEDKIVQISNEAVQTFRIDFELPQKVLTKDPGKLYGE